MQGVQSSLRERRDPGLRGEEMGRGDVGDESLRHDPRTLERPRAGGANLGYRRWTQRHLSQFSQGPGRATVRVSSVCVYLGALAIRIDLVFLV